MKLPAKRDLTRLLVALKRDIHDDYRAHEDDDEPSMLVTVGADDKGRWSYQTGDNSYSGGAYLYPHWGVVSLYRNSNCKELANDLQNQIHDALYEAQYGADTVR